MALLYVSEYPGTGYDHGGGVAVANTPAITTQVVVNTGATTQSAAFNANTRLVRLETDSICSFKFGTNPTATTADPRMAANQTEYFAIQPGGGMKVAVIVNT